VLAAVAPGVPGRRREPVPGHRQGRGPGRVAAGHRRRPLPERPLPGVAGADGLQRRATGRAPGGRQPLGRGQPVPPSWPGRVLPTGDRAGGEPVRPPWGGAPGPGPTGRPPRRVPPRWPARAAVVRPPRQPGLGQRGGQGLAGRAAPRAGPVQRPRCRGAHVDAGHGLRRPGRRPRGRRRDRPQPGPDQAGNLAGLPRLPRRRRPHRRGRGHRAGHSGRDRPHHRPGLRPHRSRAADHRPDRPGAPGPPRSPTSCSCRPTPSATT
jgi:hypothetical protein